MFAEQILPALEVAVTAVARPRHLPQVPLPVTVVEMAMATTAGACSSNLTKESIASGTTFSHLFDSSQRGVSYSPSLLNRIN
jgi:hypothetical protein